MHTSHSPSLNTAEPLRTASAQLGTTTNGPGSDRAGHSFNALYDNESTSLDRNRQDKSNDINELNEKKAEKERQDSAREDTAEAARSNSKSRGAATNDSNSEQVETQGKTDSVKDRPAKEEQEFETVQLHGVSIALPANKLQSGRVAPGGKNLPATGENSTQMQLMGGADNGIEKREQLTKSDAELEALAARTGSTDVAFRNMGGSEGVGRSRQAKADKLMSVSSDSSTIENLLDDGQIKTALEALADKLPTEISKPVKELAPTPVSSNSLASLAAITNTDAMATQKQALSTDSLASSDLNLNIRGNSSEWSNTIGDKVRWMRNASVSTAELKLNPAELGSIEIKIVTEDQQARVTFITSSASARDIIEESLPKLREMLADSGIALEQSDISHKESDSNSEQEEKRELAINNHVERELEQEFSLSQKSPRIGQVDQYV